MRNIRDNMNIDEIQIKNAIRLLLGGYILDGGDVEDIPEILKEMIRDYNKEIIKNKD